MSARPPEFPTSYCFPVELREGDRVALLVPPSEAYLDVVIGLLAAGVVPIPLDPRLTTYERERILAGLSPALQVTDAVVLDELRAAYPGSRELPRARPMHCTSGTTGTPKGVWSGLLSDEDAAALVAEERSLWGFTDTDVNLVLSPLYHSAPLRFAMGTALAGGRVLLPGPFSPEAVTSAIEEHRPTSMFCVPTHLQRLFAHWDEVGTPDLASFRLVAHAGAPCPEAVKRRVVETFPEGSTWEFYGSTEGQFTACRSEEWLERPGTVGRARPGRVLSTDDDGTIWCAVPPFARFTYFGEPEKTAAAWRDTPDGPAFTVGDLGRLDANGYLFLDGRREDLIISGGVNVYPLGRAGAPGAPGRRRRRGVRRRGRRLGPAGLRGVRRRLQLRGARRVRPRAAGTTQATQDLAPARRAAAHAHGEGRARRPATVVKPTPAQRS
jgi:long-chain acyl-CoA synthetase